MKYTEKEKDFIWNLRNLFNHFGVRLVKQEVSCKEGKENIFWIEEIGKDCGEEVVMLELNEDLLR